MAIAAADTTKLRPGFSRPLVDHPLPESPRSRVQIVGAGPSASRAARELEESGEYDVVGFVSDNAPGGAERPWVIGRTSDIPRLVQALAVQQVIVAEAPAWQQQLTSLHAEGAPSPVAIHVVPGVYEARLSRRQLHRVRDLPLVDLTPANPKVGLVFKRALDFLIASMGLVLAAPAMALAALAIKATSTGPVFFRQERVGKSGRPFTIYKLRTMVADAEKSTGPVLSSGASDPRITPLGKLLRASRLDELPQLFNVLRGEMSVVGPRPERPCFVERFEAEIPGYRERHQFLPGITGLAQVNGGYAIDAELKLRYDLLYVYNWSLWLDLQVMFQTVWTMCRRTGQ
jgi:exopolysaccharide biosynthesis polyprenyl glycosylphosphotransferase